MDNLAQGCPWSLPSSRPFPGGPLGPTTAGPSPGNQAEQEGGFTVLVGVGGERQMRKKDNFWLSSSVARGWSSFFFLAQSTRSPWRWEEEKEELGI